ncbi:MAG TPA: DMT family transporter, partial [Chthoniobacterales bacterium]|nr:DMT family transporter [Chthoniobacterales bacterium]
MTYRFHVTARWKIVAAYVVLCVVWSSTWLAIKIGLNDLPPISYVGIRFLIAFLVLVAVSIGRVPLLPRTREDWLLLGFTGVIMFALNYGLLFWGELHVSSGLAAVLQATIPVFGMLFAHWLLPAEPLRWQQLGGALLAIAGIALICGRLFGHHGMLAFWGGLGIALGGAGAAFSNVLLKRRALEDCCRLRGA